jgi:hypothetical protein
MEMPDSIQLKHETARVRDIIKNFRDGRLVVPEFQRDYVWARSRAPKLIDSLYRGYPISSLLVWESEEHVEVRRQEPRRALNASLGWLVDGQQRVITLVRTISGDEDIDVVFNVETEAFSRANAATRQDNRWVRVAEVWDEDSFIRHRRNLPDDGKGRLIERRLNRLRTVLDYEVPIERMIGYTFTDAVKAFTRINSYGVRLKKEDLQSAEVAAKHSGFILRRLGPFLHDLHKKGFDRLSATHLFRACAFIAHPDGRQRTPLHQLETGEVEKAWRRTTSAVEAAIGLIGGELGIADMSVLWSGSLLVPVIALCSRPAKERDDREIAGWVAEAALCHRYSRSSETALEQDLRACRGEDPIRSLLANLKQRRAFLEADATDFGGTIADRSGLLATFVACKQLGARDLVTRRAIQLRSKVDRHHILPRSLFAAGIERQRADVLANIAFVVADSNQSIGDAQPATYLASIPTEVLESQAIPTERSLWDVNRAREFWAKRQELLARAFNDYLRSALPRRQLVR